MAFLQYNFDMFIHIIHNILAFLDTLCIRGRGRVHWSGQCALTEISLFTRKWFLLADIMASVWKGKTFLVVMSIFSLPCTSVNDASNHFWATQTDADVVFTRCGCHVGRSRELSSVQKSSPQQTRASQTGAAVPGWDAAWAQLVWQRGAVLHAATRLHAGKSIWTESQHCGTTCQKGEQAWRQDESLTFTSTGELTE